MGISSFIVYQPTISLWCQKTDILERFLNQAAVLTTSIDNNEGDIKMYTCPVCGYEKLLEPAYDRYGCCSYEICPSCGYQYGYHDDDQGISHAQYRDNWIKNGAKWHSRVIQKPDNWDAKTQLLRIGIKL